MDWIYDIDYESYMHVRVIATNYELEMNMYVDDILQYNVKVR
jgi:hypothetical protein